MSGFPVRVTESRQTDLHPQPTSEQLPYSRANVCIRVAARRTGTSEMGAKRSLSRATAGCRFRSRSAAMSIARKGTYQSGSVARCRSRNPHSQVSRDGGWSSLLHRSPSRSKKRSAGCGFPALPIRRERERQVEDTGSPCRCDDFVTLAAESQYSIILTACEIIAPTAPSRSTLRDGAALAEVAQVDHCICQRLNELVASFASRLIY
jgi:hypothetical protein